MTIDEQRIRDIEDRTIILEQEHLAFGESLKRIEAAVTKSVWAFVGLIVTILGAGITFLLGHLTVH